MLYLYPLNHAMLLYTTAQTEEALTSILALQEANLRPNISPETRKSQGFLIVKHDLATLRKMNAIEQSIIAKDGDRVAAYLLAMTVATKWDVPVLASMFDMFDQVEFEGKKISDYTYMVVGQVCVGDGYRGRGVFDHCYKAFRNQYSYRYDFAITEISRDNLRSINAHKRVGFETIHHYQAPDGEWWNIVVWNWKK
jgi:hypothetical protein